MTTANITVGVHGVLHVTGDLDFRTVPELFTESKPLLAKTAKPIIDLSGVDRANSAGLVLLLEWLDATDREQRVVRFRHIPDSILNIAKVSNVLELLPQAADVPASNLEGKRQSMGRKKKRRPRGRH